jgi:hypothetical protein
MTITPSPSVRLLEICKRWSCSMRLFLCDENGDDVEFPTNAPSPSMKLTYMTNFESLGNLIDIYNGKLTPAESQFSIDRSVVRIRDGIAHGRLTSLSAGFPVTLYKFGKPKSGFAAVEFTKVLTETWLEASRIMIREQMDKVLACSKGRGYKSLS